MSFIIFHHLPSSMTFIWSMFFINFSESVAPWRLFDPCGLFDSVEYLLAARIQRVSTVVTCDRAPTHLSKNTFDTTYIDCIDHSVLLPAVRLAPAGIALLQVLIQIQCRREGLCPCCHMAFKVANVSVAICISRGNSRIAKGLSSKGHRLGFWNIRPRCHHYVCYVYVCRLCLGWNCT